VDTREGRNDEQAAATSAESSNPPQPRQGEDQSKKLRELDGKTQGKSGGHEKAQLAIANPRPVWRQAYETSHIWHTVGVKKRMERKGRWWTERVSKPGRTNNKNWPARETNGKGRS